MFSRTDRVTYQRLHGDPVVETTAGEVLDDMAAKPDWWPIHGLGAGWMLIHFGENRQSYLFPRRSELTGTPYMTSASGATVLR